MPTPTGPPTVTATALPPTDLPASELDLRTFIPQVNEDVRIFLTVDALSSETLYLYDGSMAFYKSEDGGHQWEPITGHRIMNIHPLALNLLFQRNIAAGFWGGDMGFSSRVASILGVDPQNPMTLYAIYRSDTSYTYAKSTDNGLTWVPFQIAAYDRPEDNPGITTFAISPLRSDLLFQSNAMNIHKSENGGQTWQQSIEGLNIANDGYWNPLFYFDFAQANIVYFYTAGSIHKSLDSGNHWQELPLPEAARERNLRWMALDPRKPATLYLSTSQNHVLQTLLFQSTDGGQTWSETTLGLPTSDVYSFTIDPLNPSIRYAILAAGQTSGLFKTLDGGQTWTEIVTTLLP